MVTVTYIEADGAEHVVAAEVGLTLMEVAVKAGVPGILADCGGSAACGTCRVFVDPAWQAEVGGPNDMEEAMLELSLGEPEGRRLSCQVTVTEALEGLVVRLPESQF